MKKVALKHKKSAPTGSTGDSATTLPFETRELRKGLDEFLKLPVEIKERTVSLSNSSKKTQKRLGSFKWGVYAFFDYDGEPIYVGQTNEMLSTRIRRHLTNHRTDAVAMNVLDPFEVCSVAVWPLPQFDGVGKENDDAKAHLNALEYQVFQKLLAESQFQAVLNEKIPSKPPREVTISHAIKQKVVSQEVSEMRDHPDLRIARRALILSRLAQVISERKVGRGLRQTLVTQAKRLQWLAERRMQGAPDVKDEIDLEG